MTTTLKPAKARFSKADSLKKISIFADEIYASDAGLEPALQLMNRVGVGNIDLRVVNGYDALINVSAALVDQTEALLKKYNIHVAALGTPLFKCPLRGSIGPAWGAHHGIGRNVTYDHYLDILPRVFELADRFGTSNIRTFCFWREHALEDVFDEVVEKMRYVARIAEKSGHTLYLENEHNTMAGTGVEQARILEAVNSPAMVALYDDGNAGRLAGVPYPNDYQALRKWVRHVHIKHRRLDVMCGWMTPARQQSNQISGVRPYYTWTLPGGRIRGEIKYGNKVFPITAARSVETVLHSVAPYHRDWLRSLRRDGYEGYFTIDNTWEGLSKRSVEEKEKDIRIEVEALAELIYEVWNEELTVPGTHRQQ